MSQHFGVCVLLTWAKRRLRVEPGTTLNSGVTLTADAMPAQIQIGLDASFNAYLAKPVVVREFIETLQLLLSKEKLVAVLPFVICVQNAGHEPQFWYLRLLLSS